VKGAVLSPIVDGSPGITGGGLKLMLGNVWVNAGVAVGGVSKAPDPSERKNSPVIVLVEIVIVEAGVIQDTGTELDGTDTPPMLVTA